MRSYVATAPEGPSDGSGWLAEQEPVEHAVFLGHQLRDTGREQPATVGAGSVDLVVEEHQVRACLARGEGRHAGEHGRADRLVTVMGEGGGGRRGVGRGERDAVAGEVDPPGPELVPVSESELGKEEGRVD